MSDKRRRRVKSKQVCFSEPRSLYTPRSLPQGRVYNNVRDQLETGDKDFLNQVENKLKQDDELLHRTCNFVINKVGDKSVTNFKSLETADKLQACLDHLAISLVAGNVSQEEISAVMKPKPARKKSGSPRT